MQKKGKKRCFSTLSTQKKETETQSKQKKKEKRNSANEKTEIQSTGKKTGTANTHTEEKKPTRPVGVCERGAGGTVYRITIQNTGIK